MIEAVSKFRSRLRARHNLMKKRSLYAINEHFEEDFNTVLLSAIVFQLPVRGVC